MLKIQARKIFLSAEFPEITASTFDKAVASVPNADDRLAYVSIDDRFVLQYASHYLIYGSERICDIAAALRGRAARDYLLVRVGKANRSKVRILGSVSV